MSEDQKNHIAKMTPTDVAYMAFSNLDMIQFHLSMGNTNKAMELIDHCIEWNKSAMNIFVA